MTPEKQEAIRLINLFSKVGLQTRSEGIECAKICVDEIIKCTRSGLGLTIFSKEYWYKVKKHIEQYENLINI